MIYDATRTSLISELRFLANDRDAENPLLSDEEYQASIDKYANWKRAAHEVMYAVADILDRRITGTTSPDDGGTTWSAQRTTSLRKRADLLLAEAVAEDAAASQVNEVGKVVTVSMSYLTDDPWEGAF